jgi:hypothetical protein
VYVQPGGCCAIVVQRRELALPFAWRRRALRRANEELQEHRLLGAYSKVWRQDLQPQEVLTLPSPKEEWRASQIPARWNANGRSKTPLRIDPQRRPTPVRNASTAAEAQKLFQRHPRPPRWPFPPIQHPHLLFREERELKRPRGIEPRKRGEEFLVPDAPQLVGLLARAPLVFFLLNIVLDLTLNMTGALITLATSP